MTPAHPGTARALLYGTRSYTMSVADRIPDPMIEPRIGRSVSLDHAAELLGVSRRTIYNRIRDGRLQTIRTAGGSQRVLVESLYDLGFRPQAYPTSASAASFEPRPVTRS